jgi:ParB/RepB/Spo0J family partition protein
MQSLDVRIDSLSVGNIRELYENIVELAESLEKTGQQVPIVVGKLTEGKRQLFDGHRRVQAAILKGWPTLKAVESDRVLTKDELTLWQLVNDVQREHLTPAERAKAAIKVRLANPDMTVKQLDGLINMGESLLWKYLQAERLSSVAMEAFEDGRIGLTEMVEVAKHPHDKQADQLGKSRDEIRKGRKRQETDELPPERTAKVKIPLAINTTDLTANGTVTVASLPGEEMDMDGVEGLLTAALKAVRDAKKKGISPKSFSALMKDVAAAN